MHRAGRTARGGREGTSIIICEKREFFILEKFEKALNIQVVEGELFEGRIVLPGAEELEEWDGS